MTSEGRPRNRPALTDELSEIGELSVQVLWIDRIMMCNGNSKMLNIFLR